LTTLAPKPVFERARPLLGTHVSIRIEGVSERGAHHAIDEGFSVIEAIHRLMSFHETSSDISILNREAAHGPVAVAPETYDVLRHSLDMAAASGGVFDVTIAAQLVAWGFLPRPENAPSPDPEASWRDIELDQGCVRFRRPLWIDVGGIAKGYGVDQAMERIIRSVVPVQDLQCCVNAGGDLRVAGSKPERVALRTAKPSANLPVIEIENGSVASSSGREHLRRHDRRLVGPHLNGLSKAPVGTRTFVTVIAETCVLADALTKVVLGGGKAADTVLRDRGATAYVQNARGAWRILGKGKR
jgi:thiamine biosynthesis lipoprotein